MTSHGLGEITEADADGSFVCAVLDGADDVDCCGTGNVSPSLNCQGTNDSAVIWVKVENIDGLACVPYELKYHF